MKTWLSAACRLARTPQAKNLVIGGKCALPTNQWHTGTCCKTQRNFIKQNLIENCGSKFQRGSFSPSWEMAMEEEWIYLWENFHSLPFIAIVVQSNFSNAGTEGTERSAKCYWLKTNDTVIVWTMRQLITLWYVTTNMKSCWIRTVIIGVSVIKRLSLYEFSLWGWDFVSVVHIIELTFTKTVCWSFSRDQVNCPY